MTGLPEARIEPEPRRSWAWLLPVVALALVVLLLRDVWNERGPRLAIHAPDGHGLAPGDAVRHRGIEVGRVERVELSSAASGVLIRARLARSAGVLARQGTRFWIQRPMLGIEGARGLETLLGSRYLALEPGPPGTPAQAEFECLPEPPLFELEEEDGIEIFLDAPQRFGLARGAPVSYRGVQVGRLVSVGLASDATTVEIRARIRASYGELVREDTRFWKQGGAELSLGLSGLDLEVGSLQSLWMGGVALATPTRPGPRAGTGQRYVLHDRPEEDWLEWRPALPLGNELFPAGTRVPELVPVRLLWEEERLFSRSKARSGWALCVAGGLVAPADLLVPPAEAKNSLLELGGERVALEGSPLWSRNDLAQRTLALGPGAPVTPNDPRLLAEPADCIAVVDAATRPIAISALHLQATGSAGCWRVSPEVVFEASYHGAAVLRRADGELVGLLLVQEGRGRIAGWAEAGAER